MSVIRRYNPATSQWEEILAGVQGPQGFQGKSFAREARSDWDAVNNRSYIGIAAEGTAESTAAWRVTRISISGSTVTVTQASSIRWTDRLTATYS